VFGSHVAQVLRRLRRVAAHYGASPVVVLASATVAEPATMAARLVADDVVAVTDDGSPRGGLDFAFWEPPFTDLVGEHGAPVRRSATSEAGELLADLVAEGVRTVAFVRSRRSAESVALAARRALDDVAPGLGRLVAAYRAGYLAEERRELEHALHSGELLGLASTNALELGVDVSGLDAVIVTGWPGTRASMWQQVGRAGRARQQALAVFVARDDPLDTYVVTHPESLFGQPVEATVLDPDNPHVLGPHLCAAAAEIPLTDNDIELFGPATPEVLADLTRRGLLRHRPAGWFWTKRERATDLADLRGTGEPPVRIVEDGTGRLLGTVDAAAAHTTVHAGAVYLHQGVAHVVREFLVDDGVALVARRDPGWSTTARELTDIRIVEALRSAESRGVGLHFGTVDVTSQVVSFQRRRLGSGEILGEEPLDLPPRQLRTRAVWWTADPPVVAAARVHPADLPGAAHAAEHAAIGLLPLFATCDRWDIGGVSTALHPDTGKLTVFVYDGHPSGAGFADRGHRRARDWLATTRDAIDACGCEAGCPSCLQSPKCGNGNDPLDKAGAVRLLTAVLGALPG
jgi:DEAD/DEAH box helicase domain-containing protein